MIDREVGATFQDVTKNVILLTNLRQKLNFGIKKSAHANFAKITSIMEQVTCHFLMLLLSAGASSETAEWN